MVKKCKNFVAITVWWAFQGDGKRKIILCDGNINSKEYQYLRHTPNIWKLIWLSARLCEPLYFKVYYKSFKRKWPCSFLKLTKLPFWLEYYLKLLKCTKKGSKR